MGVMKAGTKVRLAGQSQVMAVTKMTGPNHAQCQWIVKGQVQAAEFPVAALEEVGNVPEGPVFVDPPDPTISHRLPRLFGRRGHG